MPNCANNSRIHQILAVLMILGIMALSFVTISSNNVFAQSSTQTLHDRMLYQVINQTSGPEQRSQIDVGSLPAAIGVDENTNLVYVANSDSNTISVISAVNNTKIGPDIPVGVAPAAVGINENTNLVYVANSDSDGISVIEAISNKIVARVTFHVNPVESGYILCDGFTGPYKPGQFIDVPSGSQCTAKPNPSFEFVSWQENLEDNSTPPITLEAKLNITKFGTFTANFKEVPPLISQESLIVLVITIVGSIIGGSIMRPYFEAFFAAQRRKDK